ncbi:MAG: 1-acyl-sn-glycerol-3-phosphate acyltransferase [Firmicutes bacterium]|nr:1-acyl-sn-glycerol-3-phosphate acyltransferase [Bacillota bacterium]
MTRILLMVWRNILRVPSMWIKLCRYAKHLDKYSEQERWDHISYILQRAVLTGNLDLTVTGVENIPAPDAGGFLMYGNHQGMFDVVAIAATSKTPLAAVLKKELEGIPFVQQIIDCTRSYPMDREDARQSMRVMQQVTKDVQDGRGILIFPEGTRSKKGNEMLEFHGGSFKCALKAKCPIIPIAMIDCYKVLDQKGTAPVKVQLHYLEPIPYEEYQDMKTGELAAYVQEKIRVAIEANLEG